MDLVVGRVETFGKQGFLKCGLWSSGVRQEYIGTKFDESRDKQKFLKHRTLTRVFSVFF